MITAVTIHALERMQERTGCTHLMKAIRKKRERIATDGVTDIKGYRYVARGGVLITVLPRNRDFYKKWHENPELLKEYEAIEKLTKQLEEA